MKIQLTLLKLPPTDVIRRNIDHAFHRFGSSTWDEESSIGKASFDRGKVFRKEKIRKRKRKRTR